MAYFFPILLLVFVNFMLFGFFYNYGWLNWIVDSYQGLKCHVFGLPISWVLTCELARQEQQTRVERMTLSESLICKSCFDKIMNFLMTFPSERGKNWCRVSSSILNWCLLQCYRAHRCKTRRFVKERAHDSSLLAIKLNKFLLRANFITYSRKRSFAPLREEVP